ncbi:MAG: hypothetical protein AB7R90_19360 [Reyranellaceae bacterium]
MKRRLHLLKPAAVDSSPRHPERSEGSSLDSADLSGAGEMLRAAQPDGRRKRGGTRSAALFPGAMIASLRGRILARRDLLPQSVGDRERLEHERAIAEYESEIARIEKAGVEQAGAGA